ncbi:MAG: glycine zipper 2TM domain-containing protein [Rubrivivax sp.]
MTAATRSNRTHRAMPVLALGLAFIATSALADRPGRDRDAFGDTFRDHARVLSAEPQYEQVNTPRQVCRTVLEPEVRHQRGDAGLAGPIVGGVAGGLVGSQFGRGEGRVAAAAVGAIAGALIGQHLSDRPAGATVVHEREVQRCRFVDDWSSRLTGYRVTYEYAGRVYTTTLPYDPGRRLAVQVSVSPATRDRRSF